MVSNIVCIVDVAEQRLCATTMKREKVIIAITASDRWLINLYRKNAYSTISGMIVPASRVGDGHEAD